MGCIWPVPLNRKIGGCFFALLQTFLLASTATAGDTEISVQHAEIRATFGTMTATGGYARISNSGHAAVTLVGIDVDFADKVEIHTMFVESGVMKMRPLEGGLVIPAHGEALLEPGGNHLMFMGLTGAMKPGSIQQIILRFDDGQTVSLMAKVKKPADISGARHDHSAKGHDHSDASRDKMKLGSGG